MKRACFVSLFLGLTTSLLSQSNPVSLISPTANVVSPISASQADPKAQARILDGYGKLPLSFEANYGQTDAQVKFLSRAGGYSLFLTRDEAVFAWSGRNAKKSPPQGLKPASLAGSSGTAKAMPFPRIRPAAKSTAGGVLRMKLRNANPTAEVTGVEELAGAGNCFIGNDPAKWRTNVPTYTKVKYEGIYSGIDLVYYGNQRQLEYDFIVAPGADPRRIQFDVRGAKRIRRDEHGDLVLKTGEGEIRWHKPIVYQEKNGARHEIAARYAITDTNRVVFEVAKYDVGRPLYIDPLIYSTYLGGSGDDEGYGIAVDNAGNAYVTGQTASTDFPTTNPLQPGYGGNGDAFVTKLNANGSALMYSTYIGGSGGDVGFGIAVDSGDNAYVTGYTGSTDFPTMNPLQPSCGGNGDAFVTKINSNESALDYSTYLGGTGADIGAGIAVDGAGNAYVTGQTNSTDFPTINPLQPANGGGNDAFVSKINASGSALVYSTYLGGGSDEDDPFGQPLSAGIAVDSAGNAYVTGQTYSTNFPITPGAFQTFCAGGQGPCAWYGDAFVSKLNPTGSALVYSTYLGGVGRDSGYGIAVDSAGDAYVTGQALAMGFPSSFPVTPGAFQTTCNNNCVDSFVTRIDHSGSVLVYSTFLGGWGGDRLENWAHGIAADGSGNAYVIGKTQSIHFPTKNPLQAANAGGYDAFVAKIDVRAVTTTTLSSSPNPSTYGQAVTFTAAVVSYFGTPPDGETVTFMKGAKVLGTGALSGGSASFTTSALPEGAAYFTVVYGGNAVFAGSKSKAVKQVVSKATTTTTLVSSLNPSGSGQTVTFTASVTPLFSGTANGTVTFYDGTTALKTAGMNKGVARFTIKTLALGAHSITATYNGNPSFTGSSASLTQTVN